MGCWCDTCTQNGCKHRMIGPLPEGEVAKTLAEEYWEAAPIWRGVTRMEAGGDRAYTLAQFIGWYGEEDGVQRWEAVPISDITSILRIIKDIERRTALHLAFLHDNPKTWTPCCSHPYCFRCQVGNWHEGES